MATQVERLLILQECDRRISRLTQEQQDLPQHKRAIEAQLDSYKQVVEQSEDAIRKKTMEQKDLEAQIEQREERISKLRQQQFDVKSNDDYKAMEHQILTIKQEIAGLEEQDLELMESVEELERVRDEKQQLLADEEQSVAEQLTRFGERATSMEEELSRLRTERETLIVDVDPDWLSRYDRIFKHVGDFALVTVDNSTCGGCHMKLPPQIAHDARRLDSMTTCMYCGRLLYFIP